MLRTIFNPMDETQQSGWPGAIHSLLRVVTGGLFIQHGVQKLFGLLVSANHVWNGPPPVLSQFWFAGVLEVFGGILIVLGLFTRPVAFLLSGEMAVAYFQAHFPRNFWPVLNGGENVVLFCFVFFYLFVTGAGSYSLDALLGARRHSRSRGPAAHPVDQGVRALETQVPEDSRVVNQGV